MKQFFLWLLFVLFLIFISYNSFGSFPLVFNGSFLVVATAFLILIPIAFVGFGLNKLLSMI